MIREFQDGDIKTSGKLFATDKREVELALTYRLRMFFGENFLNLEDGTPWFQSILGKVPQDVAELNVKERIITTPDVIDIQRFNFETDRDERTITVSAVVLDNNGDLTSFLLNEGIV